jgi:hypothetical protein
MAGRQRYDVHPGVAMVGKWTDELKAKSGRSVDEWVALIQSKGPKDTKARREWLKREHSLGTNSAWWLVDRAEGAEDEGDPAVYLRQAGEFVEAMFAGSKAGLRPIYDALYDLARSFGDEIKISPGKTIVPIYRKHVIAQIRPATKTRLDFGYALKELPAKGRLIDTGGRAKGDRITHKIELTSAQQVDDEVRKLLRKAYELDA